MRRAAVSSGIIGVALLVAGVALIHIPAALVVAGVILLVLAWLALDAEAK
jgi:hypothetical protein